jgi:DNA invertase Pin-like site-specific DNA recombinase
MAALVLCRQSNSILICAKLDRLSRNVAFTSRLLESDVEIIFCDFPEANRLILHIISSIAEYEAKLISERTRQSLKAKKANGVKLGKPENLLNNHHKAIRRSVKTNQCKARHNQNNRRATALINMMKKEGKTYMQIAEVLDKQGFKTSKGCRFTASQVWPLYRQYLQ